MKAQRSLLSLLPVCCLLTAQVLAGGVGGRPTLRTTPVVGMFDELKELFPDTNPDPPQKKLSVHVARNTIASVHLMLAQLQGTARVSFTVTDGNGRPIPGAQWYRMIDVPVTENTGLDRCTEKFSGMTNPFVIRRAPFRIFDPFEPVTSPLKVDSATMALRLDIPIDSSSKPGTYTHQIRLDFGERMEVLEFVVIVHRALVPPLNRSTVSYINWHNLDNICRIHGVEKWSEPFWEMLSKYVQLMAKGRQNTFWFLWGDFFSFDAAGNVTVFRQDLLERYIKMFLHLGFRTIHGAPIVARRNWSSTDMLLTVQAADGAAVDAVSEKGKLMISQMATRVIAMMRENQWDGQWLQGIFDEPTDEFVDRYKGIAALLRTLKPDIRLLEATMTMKLSGVVNVWCPQEQEYQANRDFFDQRKAAGDKVWVYTCLAPGGPWLNRLCDQERLRQVYIGWACARFDLQGFLHWGLNSHTDKPFEELVRLHGVTEFLPAGDSHILYPKKESPLSSHRFEAHRIGMEDYELLAQLKAKHANWAQQIIAETFQAFDAYSKDIATYRKAKLDLLEAVDSFTNE